MLRFIESWDHYSTVVRKWDFNFNVDIQNNAGRFGSGDAAAYFGNTDHRIQKVIDAQPTWIIGFPWYSNTTAFGDNQPILSILDGSTYQCSVSPVTAGPVCTLRAYRGSVGASGTSLGTGTIQLKQLRWYWIEVLFTISDTVGVIQTKIDGVTDLNLTSQDTKVTSNATGNIIQLGGDAGGGRGMYIGDLYVCDGTGSAPTNTFLGDVRVQCIMPNGNGTTSQLIGQDSDSTNNYQNVDDGGPDTDPDDDTTYNQHTVVGNKDTYAYTDVNGSTGTVYGVQISPYARKTDAGTRKICSIARLSGTEVDGPDKDLSTTYQYLSDIRETKPGGGAWTPTDINNAEFGMKITV